MQTHNLSKSDIAHLHVRTFRESAALFAGVPDTTGQAQYSLPFALAAMMQHGAVGPEQISGDGLTDPNVATLMDRITVEEDATYSDRFPARRCADVTLTLANGAVLESGEIDARGGPEAPLGLDEIEAKLMRFAAPTIGKQRAGDLWDMRTKLAEPGHLFAELVSLVTPAPSRPVGLG